MATSLKCAIGVTKPKGLLDWQCLSDMRYRDRRPVKGFIYMCVGVFLTLNTLFSNKDVELVTIACSKKNLFQVIAKISFFTTENNKKTLFRIMHNIWSYLLYFNKCMLYGAGFI